MPRRTRTEPRTVTAASYIVQNPRGIPAGHHIIKWHACSEDREDPNDHTSCTERRWCEGDTFEPPEGFGLARFLQHQPMAGRTCDEGHEGCAGPFLAEGVSNDGEV